MQPSKNPSPGTPGCADCIDCSEVSRPARILCLDRSCRSQAVSLECDLEGKFMPSPTVGFRRLLAVCLACSWLMNLGGVGITFAQGRQFASTQRSDGAVGGHVAVIGAIARPGAYELPAANVNITDVVQIAGGLTSEASGNVRVIRKGHAGLQTFYSAQTRYPLWDGDVIVIDQRLARAQSPSRGGQAPLTSVALVNLIGRPVVVDLPPQYASVRGLLQLLRSPVSSQASIYVMAPGRAPQALSLPLTSAPAALMTGAVVVFDPTSVMVRNLPPLPPAIRPQDVLAAQAAGRLPPNGTANHPGTDHPSNGAGRGDAAESYSNPEDAPVRRSRMHVWNGSAGDRTQPNQQPPANSRPLPSATSTGSTPAPLLSIGNPGAPSSVNLPNPLEPFSAAAPSASGTGPDAMLVTASTANSPPGDLQGGDFGTGTRTADVSPALPSTTTEASPIDEPAAAPVTKKGTKRILSGNLVLSILGGLALLAGLGMWIKHRAAAKLVGLSTAATTSSAVVSPVAETVAPAPAVSSAPSHQPPVPRPHFAAAAIAARRPSVPEQYDVVMPPEQAASAPTARPTLGGSNRVDPVAQPGLLDRVLASVHAQRKH